MCVPTFEYYVLENKRYRSYRMQQEMEYPKVLILNSFQCRALTMIAVAFALAFALFLRAVCCVVDGSHPRFLRAFAKNAATRKNRRPVEFVLIPTWTSSCAASPSSSAARRISHSRKFMTYFCPGRGCWVVRVRETEKYSCGRPSLISW